MRLILQIAAGVLLANTIWAIGEAIMARVAIAQFEAAVTAAMQQPAPTVQTRTTMAPTPSRPQPPPLPQYPFPSNDVPVGNYACMNGITMRHETNGWTQVSGSTVKATCLPGR